MALHIYCLIYTALITMDCAVNNHCSARNDGNTGQKRKWSFPYRDNENLTSPAKKMNDIGDQRYIPEFSTDDLACLNGEASRADSEERSLPSFMQAFGECSETLKFKHFATYCERTICQHSNDGSMIIDQTSRNSEIDFACPSAEACTSQQASYDDISHSYIFAESFDASNPLDYNETQNLEEPNSESPELLSKHSTKTSDELSAQPCLENQNITDIIHEKQKANLLTTPKQQEMSSLGYELSIPTENVEEKFYKLLKRYDRKTEYAQKGNSVCHKNDFGILQNELKSYQVMQKTNSLKKRDSMDQNEICAEKLLPDFEKYYKRCGTEKLCELNDCIIFSQNWNNLKDTEGHILMYTHLAKGLSSLDYSSNEEIIFEKVTMLCGRYYLTPNICLSKVRWKNDDIYRILDYFKGFDSTKKTEGTELKIESAHYTLEKVQDFSAKFAIFKQFIFDTFFCKKSGAIFYTIKAKLWRLQIFMPEIYFYLTWRLKIKHDISVNNEGKEYGLKEEIEIITEVVNKFHIVSQSKTNSDIETINLTLAVKELRFAILVMLGKHFEASTLYQFYKIAFKTSVLGSYSTKCIKSRDLFFILAFAAKTSAYDYISQTIYEFNKANKIEKRKTELTMTQLTHKKIGPVLEQKKETLKILQTVVQFMRIIKPYSVTSGKEEINLYIMFKFRTVLFVPGENLQTIEIRFQTFGESLIYFHNIIFDLFAN